MNLQQIDETLSKWANDFEREGTPVSKERLKMMKHDMQIDSLTQYLFDIHELSGIAFRNFFQDDDNRDFDLQDVHTCLRIIKQQVDDALVVLQTIVKETRNHNQDKTQE